MKASHIFISGLRKSGTSLVKNLLDTHPDLFCIPPNEMHLFSYTKHRSLLKDKLAFYDSTKDVKNALVKSNFVQRFLSKNFTNTKFDPKYFTELMSHVDCADIKYLVEEYFKNLGIASGLTTVEFASKIPVFKSVMETEFLPYYKSWFPALKCVYVLRNPYAHLSAVIRGERAHRNKRFIYPSLNTFICNMYKSYYFAHKYKELYPDDMHIIVYDNLLNHPEIELDKLVKFLGIDFHEALLKPTILGSPWGGNSSVSKSRFDNIDKSPLSHWKKHIHHNEIYLINKYLGFIFDIYDFDKLPGYRNNFFPINNTESFATYIKNKFLSYKSVNVI